MEALNAGTARLGRPNRNGMWAMNYLSQGMIKEITDGAVKVLGKDNNGALILERADYKLLAANQYGIRKLMMLHNMVLTYCQKSLKIKDLLILNLCIRSMM